MNLCSFVKFFITWLQGFLKTQIKTLAVLVFALSCLLATIEALPVSRVSFTICIFISGEYCFLFN